MALLVRYVCTIECVSVWVCRGRRKSVGTVRVRQGFIKNQGAASERPNECVDQHTTMCGRPALTGQSSHDQEVEGHVCEQSDSELCLKSLWTKALGKTQHVENLLKLFKGFTVFQDLPGDWDVRLEEDQPPRAYCKCSHVSFKGSNTLKISPSIIIYRLYVAHFKSSTCLMNIYPAF